MWMATPRSEWPSAFCIGGVSLISFGFFGILYFFLEEGAPTLGRIAEALDLREKVVADLLRRIEREFPLTGEV